MNERRASLWRRLGTEPLDVGIALALCTLALLSLESASGTLESGVRTRDAVGVVLVVVMSLPIAWRQHAPRTTLVIVLAAWLVDRGIAYVDTSAMVALLIAIHAIGAFLPERTAFRWGLGTLVFSASWTALGIVTSDDVTWVHLVTIVLGVVIPFAMGRADALSRERVTVLEMATQRAEAGQREATEVAIRTERARIARELHDVVAHEITVMTLQAEGARRALGDANPAVTEALATISSSGRKGLAEMSRMIGVLRDTAESGASEAAIRTERARIARELHDVVAHEITVMTLQAEGARRALGDASPAITEALQTIGDSGRKGLAEMSRMIGVLRDTAESGASEAAVGTAYAPASVSHLDPMPGLAALPALAAQVEDAGLPVEVRMEGNAHVPAGVELSAYRIVQESLTNALKHAGPGAQATVVVEREANAVTVTVEDDGRGVVADAAAHSGGHGLAGMRERVLALGGSIDLGPRPGGGFRVRAVLPSHDDTITGVRRPRTTPTSATTIQKGTAS